MLVETQPGLNERELSTLEDSVGRSPEYPYYPSKAEVYDNLSELEEREEIKRDLFQLRDYLERVDLDFKEIAVIGQNGAERKNTSLLKEIELGNSTEEELGELADELRKESFEKVAEKYEELKNEFGGDNVEFDINSVSSYELTQKQNGSYQLFLISKNQTIPMPDKAFVNKFLNKLENGVVIEDGLEENTASATVALYSRVNDHGEKVIGYNIIEFKGEKLGTEDTEEANLNTNWEIENNREQELSHDNSVSKEEQEARIEFDQEEQEEVNRERGQEIADNNAPAAETFSPTEDVESPAVPESQDYTEISSFLKIAEDVVESIVPQAEGKALTDTLFAPIEEEIDLQSTNESGDDSPTLDHPQKSATFSEIKEKEVQVELDVPTDTRFESAPAVSELASAETIDDLQLLPDKAEIKVTHRESVNTEKEVFVNEERQTISREQFSKEQESENYRESLSEVNTGELRSIERDTVQNDETAKEPGVADTNAEEVKPAMSIEKQGEKEIGPDRFFEKNADGRDSNKEQVKAGSAYEVEPGLVGRENNILSDTENKPINKEHQGFEVKRYESSIVNKPEIPWSEVRENMRAVVSIQTAVSSEKLTWGEQSLTELVAPDMATDIERARIVLKEAEPGTVEVITGKESSEALVLTKNPDDTITLGFYEAPPSSQSEVSLADTEQSPFVEEGFVSADSFGQPGVLNENLVLQIHDTTKAESDHVLTREDYHINQDRAAVAFGYPLRQTGEAVSSRSASAREKIDNSLEIERSNSTRDNSPEFRGSVEGLNARGAPGRRPTSYFVLDNEDYPPSTREVFRNTEAVTVQK